MELVDDVQSIILMKEEEENAESHLFNYDWLDTSTQKYYDENRFLVVSIFTASLLPRIQTVLSSSFDALNQDHLLNFQQILSAARQIWDADVLLEKMIKPVTARILSSVSFSFSSFILSRSRAGRTQRRSRFSSSRRCFASRRFSPASIPTCFRTSPTRCLPI